MTSQVGRGGGVKLRAELRFCWTEVESGGWEGGKLSGSMEAVGATVKG